MVPTPNFDTVTTTAKATAMASPNIPEEWIVHTNDELLPPPSEAMALYPSPFHQEQVLFGRDEQIQELEEIFEEVLEGGGRSRNVGDGTEIVPPKTSSRQVLSSLSGGRPRRGSGRSSSSSSSSSSRRRHPLLGSNTNQNLPSRTQQVETETTSMLDGRSLSTTTTRHVVWIEGEPGTGKSALAMQTRYPCRSVGGFFMAGKFQPPLSSTTTHHRNNNPQQEESEAGSSMLSDLIRSSVGGGQDRRPYSAIADACMDLVDDLLLVYYNDNDDTTSRWSTPSSGNDDDNGRKNHDCSDNYITDPSNYDDATQFNQGAFSPENYHKWTISRTELQRTWRENRKQLKVLTPIIRNLSILLQGGGVPALDGRDENGSETIKSGNQQSGNDSDNYYYMETKQAIEHAFAQFFVLLSRLVPITVLVIDDWQWADDSSIELFESLLCNEQIEHFLLVNTIRMKGISTSTRISNPGLTDKEIIIDDNSTERSLSFFLRRSKVHQEKCMPGSTQQQQQNIQQQLSKDEDQSGQPSSNLFRPPTPGFNVHEISTEHLTVDDVVEWLERTLSTAGLGRYSGAAINIMADTATILDDAERTRSRELAVCVHKRTAGNALYVRQFLSNLHHLGLLQLSYDDGTKTQSWKFDINAILRRTVACDNVVSFLCSQLLLMGGGGWGETSESQNVGAHRSPQQQQLTIILPKLAALGTTFSVRAFEIVAVDMINTFIDEDKERDGSVAPQDPIWKTSAVLLTNLDAQGILVVDEKRNVVRWVHDKVRETALTGLAEAIDIAGMKFELGNLLLQRLSENELRKELFLVTNLLNAGLDSFGNESYLENSAQILEAGILKQIVVLNQLSAKIAFQSSAFHAAKEYSSIGIHLIPRSQRWDDPAYYPILVDLFSMAAEASFCIGEHDDVFQLYEELTEQNGIALIDKRRVCHAMLHSLIALSRTEEAKEMAVFYLSKLGCKFPQFGRPLCAAAGFARVLRTINTRTDKISKLSQVKSDEARWIICLLHCVTTYAYQCDTSLLPLSILKSLRYTINYGITDMTPPILATVGLLLAGVLGNIDGGKKYGELALKYSNRPTESRTLFSVYGFVLHFRLEYRQLHTPFLRAYEAGMESGDLETACWSAYFYVELQLFIGTPLSVVIQACERYYREMERRKQDNIIWSMKTLYQLCVNLKNNPPDGHKLQGEIIPDEEELCRELRDDSQRPLFWQMFMRSKVMLSFWYGEYQTVVETMEEAGFDKFSVEKVNPGYMGTPVLYYHCAISCLSVYRVGGVKKYKKLARKFLRRLKGWVYKGNKNVQHAETLIQAELNTFGNHMEASMCFDVADLLAERWGIVNDQAFCHERKGLFLSSIGQQDDAAIEFEKALELYRQWGAQRKIASMLVLLKRTPVPVFSVDVDGTCPTDFDEMSMTVY